jgi:aryl-alcohol dehydrogenase-like predicted oxidoreductase
MIYGNVPGISRPISRLVQGTMMMNPNDPDAAYAVMDAFFEAGGNIFDTAHVYGNGASERVVGRWLKERGLRDEIVILGKGAHPTQDRNRVTSFDIAADIHDSLARMQVEYIDLYLLHRDDPEQPVGVIVEALNEQHAAGRIGAFGGSNWTTDRIQAANEYAAAQGLRPFVASSPNFSLAEQAVPPWPGCVSISGPGQTAARQWYLENGVSLFTWSSLAGGFFSGRFERDNLDSFEDDYDQLCVKVYGQEENFKRLDRVRELAAEKALSVPQIAMAYVLAQPQGIFALVGSRNAEEVQANMAATEAKLTQDEIAWLELRSENR